MQEYLARAGITKEQLAKGGYLIRTTLDPDVQAQVKNSINEFAPADLEGVASVMSVIRPGKQNHPILAMASNRTYGLNLDAGETMQPQPFSLVGNGAGSVFKVFTTAAAMEMGMGINATLDVPSRFEAKGLGSGGARGCPRDTWCVQNAGGYRGQMSITDALATSPNTAFAKLISQVGVQKTVDMAVRLGLRSYAEPGTARDYDPDSNESLADFVKRQNIGSFTLGPIEVNALELSNVAATLASGGVVPTTPSTRSSTATATKWPSPPPPASRWFPSLANTLANAMSEDDRGSGTAASAAASAGWTLPMSGKTGTTEANRSSGFLGFTNQLAAANYIYDDSTTPSELCSFPLRQCGSGSLFGGNEPARTWFTAMAPIATNYGEVALPPTDPRYVDGAPGGRVPSVAGLTQDAARERLRSAGFQVADQATPVNSSSPQGAVVGTSPSGQTIRAPSSRSRSATASRRRPAAACRCSAARRTTGVRPDGRADPRAAAHHGAGADPACARSASATTPVTGDGPRVRQ
ncbi:hypothetical protein MMUR_66250 [Mycolicibacterium murale]|uniref:PASTA domain-containing protein n=1 Tax=Mycolicibacterium murale TaxID=182220 RepID=A0A7I9WXX0_9MYCO|nr:penicillin-binding transpeptidase domain-containing protein [Mycolicibacterium murale]GFG62489.1 hypothetical protein MMUR_66250 [Mycolicibacterium murale]